MTNKVGIVDDRDAASSDAESDVRDRGAKEVDSVGTPDRGADEEIQVSTGTGAGEKKGWAKVKELMPSTDIDDQGREKVRVNVGGLRKTVNTQAMNDTQFAQFKKKSDWFGGDLDITWLSQQLTSEVKKDEEVEDQKKSMGEMRKQITLLLSIMGVQTTVLFVLMIWVAYLFKDQFVGENGVLRDGEGNPILTGSADFQINSKGELAPSQLNGRRLSANDESSALGVRANAINAGWTMSLAQGLQARAYGDMMWQSIWNSTRRILAENRRRLGDEDWSKMHPSDRWELWRDHTNEIMWDLHEHAFNRKRRLEEGSGDENAPVACLSQEQVNAFNQEATALWNTQVVLTFQYSGSPEHMEDMKNHVQDFFINKLPKHAQTGLNKSGWTWESISEDIANAKVLFNCKALTNNLDKSSKIWCSTGGVNQNIWQNIAESIMDLSGFGSDTECSGKISDDQEKSVFSVKDRCLYMDGLGEHLERKLRCHLGRRRLAFTSTADSKKEGRRRLNHGCSHFNGYEFMKNGVFDISLFGWWVEWGQPHYCPCYYNVIPGFVCNTARPWWTTWEHNWGHDLDKVRIGSDSNRRQIHRPPRECMESLCPLSKCKDRCGLDKVFNSVEEITQKCLEVCPPKDP